MTTDAEARRGVLLSFAQLTAVGPGRLRQMAQQPDAVGAWEAVRSRRPPVRGIDAQLVAAWADEARRLDPERELRRHEAAGVSVAALGDDAYPAPLASDPAAPPILVWRGHWPEPGPRCAVVGTRRCSRYGRDVAHGLGRDLAAAGVPVVSGLALGIDGAAHAGVLSVAQGAPPIAVVAGGLDHVYPARHRELWRGVAERGLLLAEAPLGVRPEPWRFPARNRIVAALGHVLVVVESGVRGGSMATVHEAARRSRDVLAVPGPVTSAASAGTNQLLSEGCAPCRDATDVLVALGLAAPGAAGPAVASATEGHSPLAAAVLDCLVAGRRSLDQLAAELEVGASALWLELERLEASGQVVCSDGRYEVAR